MSLDRSLTMAMPFKKYFLGDNPCTATEAHPALVQSDEVSRTVFYEDGTTCSEPWSTKNYTDTSKLNNNINSGPLRGWKKKGIIGIEIKISCDTSISGYKPGVAIIHDKSAAYHTPGSDPSQASTAL